MRIIKVSYDYSFQANFVRKGRVVFSFVSGEPGTKRPRRFFIRFRRTLYEKTASFFHSFQANLVRKNLVLIEMRHCQDNHSKIIMERSQEVKSGSKQEEQSHQ